MNVLEISERDVDIIDAVLPHLMAEDELRERDTRSKITPERYKYLLIMKTGDEDFADREAAKLLALEIEK